MKSQCKSENNLTTTTDHKHILKQPPAFSSETRTF